ncbi:MAG: thioredoxin domain-containing protein [Polyangiaceae bacterium]|nr:thioredoxin domain-containing protein [Polyangiaceae bacterium]
MVNTMIDSRIARGARALAGIALAALAGCASSPEFAGGDPVAMPGPPGAGPLPAPSGEREELPGVDTRDLVARERHTWFTLVSQVYAPCADQAVSLAACVREARPCAACVPAARMLVSQIKGGAGAEDARKAYAIRFGPDVKKIDPADSASRGPADAPVQIVVWSDYECPACRRAMPILDAAFEKHSPGVRLVHKWYPLKVHKRSDPAARAAYAAKQQGRYWQMERVLFENQQALADQDLLDYAKRVGLDVARFQADMASDRAGEQIARDRAAADRAGLQGTPFIMINGREFDLGLFDLETDLEPWIATEIELARARPAAPAPGASPAGDAAPAPAAP